LQGVDHHVLNQFFYLLAFIFKNTNHNQGIKQKNY